MELCCKSDLGDIGMEAFTLGKKSCDVLTYLHIIFCRRTANLTGRIYVLLLCEYNYENIHSLSVSSYNNFKASSLSFLTLSISNLFLNSFIVIFFHDIFKL
jgi:hypothetical protein